MREGGIRIDKVKLSASLDKTGALLHCHVILPNGLGVIPGTARFTDIDSLYEAIKSIGIDPNYLGSDEEISVTEIQEAVLGLRFESNAH